MPRITAVDIHRYPITISDLENQAAIVSSGSQVLEKTLLNLRVQQEQDAQWRLRPRWEIVINNGRSITQRPSSYNGNFARFALVDDL